MAEAAVAQDRAVTPGRPVVTLTQSEILFAGFVASARHAQNVAERRPQTYGATSQSLDPGFIGALGEIAVAKHLNRFWSGSVGNFKAADVGSVQVRSTTHERGCLILHDRDADEDPFILVHLAGAVATLQGWIYGRDGKRPEFWRRDTGRPAYFVPAESLRPFKARHGKQ